MDEGGLAFDLMRRVVRAVPDRLRGKMRLARLALRPFLNGRMARIPDRFGNVLHLASLESPTPGPINSSPLRPQGQQPQRREDFTIQDKIVLGPFLQFD